MHQPFSFIYLQVWGNFGIFEEKNVRISKKMAGAEREECPELLSFGWMYFDGCDTFNSEPP